MNRTTKLLSVIEERYSGVRRIYLPVLLSIALLGAIYSVYDNFNDEERAEFYSENRGAKQTKPTDKGITIHEKPYLSFSRDKQNKKSKSSRIQTLDYSEKPDSHAAKLISQDPILVTKLVGTWTAEIKSKSIDGQNQSPESAVKMDNIVLTPDFRFSSSENIFGGPVECPVKIERTTLLVACAPDSIMKLNFEFDSEQTLKITHDMKTYKFVRQRE